MVRLFIVLIAMSCSVRLMADDAVNATLAYAGRIMLSTPVSGVVEKVAVQAGDKVTADSVLIELDKTLLLAELDAAKAAVAYTKAALDEGLREKRRNQDLYDRTLLSEHDIKLAHIAYSKTYSEYQQAQATLVRVRRHLQYSVIKAPFDGRILDVHVQPGQAIANRFQVMPLLELVRSGRLLANAELDAQQRARLKHGDTINVEVAGNRYAGRIVAIDLASSTNYSLSVEFTVSSDAALYVGQAAQITLP